MPTLLVEGPYRFYFYSHEPNEPPHVHVDRGTLTAKFWLSPVAVARRGRFRSHELSTIQSTVVRHRRRFLQAWYGYFER